MEEWNDKKGRQQTCWTFTIHRWYSFQFLKHICIWYLTDYYKGTASESYGQVWIWIMFSYGIKWLHRYSRLAYGCKHRHFMSVATCWEPNTQLNTGSYTRPKQSETSYTRTGDLDCWNKEARGSKAGWGTMLQAGRSRLRFPMRSLDFSIYLIIPAALRPCGWSRPLKGTSIMNFTGSKGRPARKADNLTNICRPTV
jgi:hypothetical protein